MNNKLEKLQEKWYKAYDYSVYDTSEYLDELLKCWSLYSKKYLKTLISVKKVGIIADLGCGFGLTTMQLAKKFPKSIVYGTNIKNTIQSRIAKELGKLSNFSVVEDVYGKKVNLIFASEYFEHIERPVEQLEKLLKKCKPDTLIIANSFTAKAIGHFNEYKHKDKTYIPREINRLFNKTLRSNGYQQLKTNLWNNRPMYWTKYES